MVELEPKMTFGTGTASCTRNFMPAYPAGTMFLIDGIELNSMALRHALPKSKSRGRSAEVSCNEGIGVSFKTTDSRGGAEWHPGNTE